MTADPKLVEALTALLRDALESGVDRHPSLPWDVVDEDLPVIAERVASAFQRVGRRCRECGEGKYLDPAYEFVPQPETTRA